MANPKFKQGFVHTGTNKKSGSNNIGSLAEALEELAKCDHCGCNSCLGHFTFLNVQTGTVMAVYVRGTDVAPTLVIQPLADALPVLQAAQANRLSGDNLTTPVYVPSYVPS